MRILFTVMATAGYFNHLLIAYNRLLATKLNVFEYVERFPISKCKRYVGQIYCMSTILGIARLIMSMKGSDPSDWGNFDCFIVNEGKNYSSVAISIITLIAYSFLGIIPVILSIGFLCAVVYMLYKGTAQTISDRNWTKTTVILLSMKSLLEMPYLFVKVLNLRIFGLDISEELQVIFKDIKLLASVVTSFVYGLRLQEFSRFMSPAPITERHVGHDSHFTRRHTRRESHVWPMRCDSHVLHREGQAPIELSTIHIRH